jgi:hypothetical protein
MYVKRAPWGSRVDPVQATWMIERERKERFFQIAKNSGYSGSAFLELVIDHIESELSDRGVPNWLPQPKRKDGELPIDSD